MDFSRIFHNPYVYCNLPYVKIQIFFLYLSYKAFPNSKKRWFLRDKTTLNYYYKCNYTNIAIYPLKMGQLGHTPRHKLRPPTAASRRNPPTAPCASTHKTALSHLLLLLRRLYLNHIRRNHRRPHLHQRRCVQ